MDKYYVFLEAAKELKVLGFNESCYRGAYTEKSVVKISSAQDFNKNVYTVSLPLYAQAFDWFDEVHGLKSWIVPTYLQEKVMHSFKINSVEYTELGFNTKEEAQIACINQLISVVTRKKRVP